MTPQQIERLLMAVERIAAALERSVDLDPMAALAAVLEAQPETQNQDDRPPDWMFK